MTDFGINRVSQRVQCIESMGVQVDIGTPTERFHPGPIAGSEYTVDAFLDCHLFKPPVPGILVREIDAAKCGCCGRMISWPLHGFRPITGKEEQAKERVAELMQLPADVRQLVDSRLVDSILDAKIDWIAP